ncbi:MAG TPA: hypothetical protein VMW03_05905 [Candidatus Krumholzibacteriaceae bacterium]|nr:hypothetical protein [Candidatus Krumholzibacteriaceae bacterium]
MPGAPQEDVKVIRVKKPEPRDGPLSLGDYLTTEPRRRHTKAQQLREARRKFLRDNR